MARRRRQQQRNEPPSYLSKTGNFIKATLALCAFIPSVVIMHLSWAEMTPVLLHTQGSTLFLMAFQIVPIAFAGLPAGLTGSLLVHYSLNLWRIYTNRPNAEQTYNASIIAERGNVDAQKRLIRGPNTRALIQKLDALINLSKKPEFSQEFGFRWGYNQTKNRPIDTLEILKWTNRKLHKLNRRHPHDQNRLAKTNKKVTALLALSQSKGRRRAVAELRREGSLQQMQTLKEKLSLK